MRALSLTQPWAWSMMHGPKFIENRTWPCPENIVGQTVAWHASAKWDPNGERFLLEHDVLVPPRHTLPKSAIIGTVKIERCIKLADFETAFENYPDGVRPVEAGPPYGGRSRDDILPADQIPFFFGPFGFLTSSRRPITPILYPGSLGFFTLTDDVVREIERRVDMPADTLPSPILPQQTMPWEPPGGLHRPPRKPSRRGRR